MDIDVREYRPGDEGGLVELLGLVFGGWPHLDVSYSPLEYWRWKFEGREGLGKFIVVAGSWWAAYTRCLSSSRVFSESTGAP
jgi:hypothetical protein